MLRLHPRSGQRIEECRLTGVRIADDRGCLQLRSPAAGPLLMSLRTHLFDLTLEVPHALADAPALDLDLLLAETTASPHPTSPASDLAVIRVGADQPRQKVVQAGCLDLQTALMCARVLGKDLEDHLGAVEDSGLQLELQVALLTRTEIVVANDQIEGAFELELAQLLDLAHADEMRRLYRRTPLHVGTHHLGPRGPREIRQLVHLLTNQLRRRARQQQPDQVRPLSRRFRRDQSFSCLSRSIASARRASGAVTESRKYPSPWAPKPTPGVMFTPTSSSTCAANPIES